MDQQPGIFILQPEKHDNQQVSPSTDTFKFPGCEAQTLGAIQIVIGAVCIICQSGIFVMVDMEYIAFCSIIGYGMWIGCWFFLCGSFGIAAGLTKTKHGIVKATLGLNIVGLIFAMLLTTLAAIDSYADPYYTIPEFEKEELAWALTMTGVGAVQQFICIRMMALCAVALTCQTSKSSKPWFPDSTCSSLGAVHMVIGVLCNVLQYSNVIICALYQIPSITFYSGYGFWCGAWFFMCGSLARAAAVTKSNSLIISVRNLSSFGSLYAQALIGLAIVDAIWIEYDVNYDYHLYPKMIQNIGIANSSFLAIAGSVELILLIWTIIICGGCCCCFVPWESSGQTRSNIVFPLNTPEDANINNPNHHVVYYASRVMPEQVVFSQDGQLHTPQRTDMPKVIPTVKPDSDNTGSIEETAVVNGGPAIWDQGHTKQNSNQFNKFPDY